MKKKYLLRSLLLCFVLFGTSACGGCDHTYGSWIVTKQATCVDAGVKVQKCTKCGYEITGVIEPLGHNFVNGVCTECGAHQ